MTRVGLVTTISCLTSIGALVAPASSIFSQVEDRGRENFMANCEQCHGSDAKGGGPRSAQLHTKPVDLTLLAKKNNGVFNASAIYQLIDGREPGSTPHLSQDMPIWGCRHQEPALVKRRVPKHYRPSTPLAPPVVKKGDDTSTWQSLLDLPCDSEQAIEGRILSIVGYLSRIQAR